MRYSRVKRVRNQRRYAFIVIILFLILGGIYFFTAGTMGKYISNFIAPILKSRQSTEQLAQQDSNDRGDNQVDQGMELTLPNDAAQDDAQEDKAPRITETIKVEDMNFFGIQMGAFNSKENAQSIADQLKTRGGAGYVLDDQYSRVIAMVFLSEGDATAVKEQLQEQSIESQLYELKCPGVDMEVTAPSEKIEGIKTSFSLVREKFGEVESIIRELDNDKITIEIAINRIGEIKNEVIIKEEQLNQYSATQEGSQVLSGLKNLLSDQANNIDQILQTNTSDKVAISSKIKYTYIDMIVKYKGYIEQITRG